MFTISIDYKNNNDSNIMCYKNENKNTIISNIVNELKKIDNDKNIIYFNYLFSEKELKDRYRLFNRKNITIVNKYVDDIDDLEKYFKINKLSYVCIDYLKMIDNGNTFMINDKSLKDTLDKLNDYTNSYDITFIVVINEESKWWYEKKIYY